jgi:arginyl-tRNA synthetase
VPALPYPDPQGDNQTFPTDDASYRQVLAKRDELLARHDTRRGAVRPPDPLGDFIGKVRTLLPGASGVAVGEVLVDRIDRDRFAADLALKFPGLLKDGGPRRFATDHAPAIRAALEGPEFATEVATVDAVGMYINLKLRDDWLLAAARTIVGAGPSYGRTDPLVAERYIVDYSSPNVAKSLHAGHIRSTIIGAVLSNVLEEAGGLVFRINHINDYGGFGFLLEGHRRFEHSLPPGSDLNERSLEIYRLRRILERAIADGASVADLPGPDGDLVRLLLPGTDSRDDLRDAMDEFEAAADRRFVALESGDPEEVALWKQIVAASLEDFSSFYHSLDIAFDFTIGESFYAQLGLKLVDEWLQSGAAVLYGDAEAAADLGHQQELLAAGDISQSEFESLGQAIRKDIGAVVVRISPSERYVVRRGDGRSIYATRDLAAVALRQRLFDPTSFIYVVGQEQKTHFERLFAASYQLGLADRDHTSFDHIYFGFYVDAHTHKKLSSRESAMGVAELLEAAQAYFRSRVSDRLVEGDEDPDSVARQLTIASIVFNDLKQDTRSSVEMDMKNPTAMVEVFDKAGGAYVIYTACRAGSIVRKASGRPEASGPDTPTDLDTEEARLLLQVLDYPTVVAYSAGQRSPSVLVRHMFDISNLYNSYNAKARVITDGGVITSRLITTAAVEQTLRNGLKLCNVDCPEYI